MMVEPGVYALIMSLPQTEKIEVGKLGEFTFGPGWYVYVGAAHGQGALQIRTNRHLLPDKSQNHWHIDYFRQLATTNEIWFNHARAEGNTTGPAR